MDTSSLAGGLIRIIHQVPLGLLRLQHLVDPVGFLDRGELNAEGLDIDENVLQVYHSALDN